MLRKSVLIYRSRMVVIGHDYADNGETLLSEDFSN